MNKLFSKLNSKSGSTDMVTILITIVIFAGVSTFYVLTITGSSSGNSGIEGASDRVNQVILQNVP